MIRTARLMTALLIGLVPSSITNAAAPVPNPSAVEPEPQQAATEPDAEEETAQPPGPPVPYQAIIDRNVFNLKPIAPPQDVGSVKKPLPEITLTGILTMWGPKRALLEAPVPAKPPEPARIQSYTLSEGDRDGEIEVLAINEKAGTVKVRNHGIEQVLDFTKNGVKIASAAPADGAGAPGTANPSPLGRSGIPRPNAANPLRNIPRTMRSGPSMPGNVNPNSAPINPNTGMAPAVPQASSSGFTPDEQAVLIELQREKALQRQDPMSTLFPPTQFSQPAPGPEAEEPDIAPQ